MLSDHCTVAFILIGYRQYSVVLQHGYQLDQDAAATGGQ